MEEEILKLRMALQAAESKLWIIECELDHREKRAIKGVNEVRAAIYEALGWKVTRTESGMMAGATKEV